MSRPLDLVITGYTSPGEMASPKLQVHKQYTLLYHCSFSHSLLQVFNIEKQDKAAEIVSARGGTYSGSTGVYPAPMCAMKGRNVVS